MDTSGAICVGQVSDQRREVAREVAPNICQSSCRPRSRHRFVQELAAPLWLRPSAACPHLRTPRVCTRWATHGVARLPPRLHAATAAHGLAEGAAFTSCFLRPPTVGVAAALRC